MCSITGGNSVPGDELIREQWGRGKTDMGRTASCLCRGKAFKHAMPLRFPWQSSCKPKWCAAILAPHGETFRGEGHHFVEVVLPHAIFVQRSGKGITRVLHLHLHQLTPPSQNPRSNSHRGTPSTHGPVSRVAGCQVGYATVVKDYRPHLECFGKARNMPGGDGFDEEAIINLSDHVRPGARFGQN